MPRDGFLTLSEDREALVLPSGTRILLPSPFDAGELTLAGNWQCFGEAALFAYDPVTSTGVAWRRNPKPHWQLIQPVSREGFEDWAAQYYRTMVNAGDFKQSGGIFGGMGSTAAH